MKIEIIKQLHKSFEEAAYDEGGLEYWLARELQSLLGYSDWRNFMSIVNKAKESCTNIGIDPNYHIVDFNKMINLPKMQFVKLDIMLTRMLVI